MPFDGSLPLPLRDADVGLSITYNLSRRVRSLNTTLCTDTNSANGELNVCLLMTSVRHIKH